ncbi:MAG: hypothetical protein ACK41T_05560 [Pseudobdellovibrio sp.]
MKMFKTLSLVLIMSLFFSSCDTTGNSFGTDLSSEDGGGSGGGNDGSGSEQPTKPPISVSSNYNFATDFFATIDTKTTYPYYLSKLNQHGTHCKVASGTIAPSDTMCVLEAPEFGFYFGGVNLVVNSPPGMCEYTRIIPYWYYNEEVGVGPTSVEIETTITTTKSLDASGVVTNVVVSNPSYRCAENGAPLGSCNAAFLEVTFPGPPPVEKCIYDHTSSGGNNCCTGNYTSIATTRNIERVIDANGAITTTTTTESFPTNKSWGDNIRSCIGGQGDTNWGNFGVRGLPAAEVFETRQGVSTTYVVTAPIISKTGSDSNLSIANYFTTAAIDPVTAINEHAHNGYAGAVGTTSILPYYVDPISDRSGNLVTRGSAYYEYQCLDDAFEIKHRIRMLLRDWDTNSEFVAYKNTGAVATPRGWDIVPSWLIGGAEGAQCTGLSPEACNDFKDPDNFVFDQAGNIYDTSNPVFRANYFPNEKNIGTK